MNETIVSGSLFGIVAIADLIIPSVCQCQLHSLGVIRIASACRFICPNIVTEIAMQLAMGGM